MTVEQEYQFFLNYFTGTYERVSEEEEEVHETLHILKLKSHVPNLRVINFFGVKFLDDSHVEAISSNCVHLECLCIKFCTKFTGSSLKILLQRCRKLSCLLMEQTGAEVLGKELRFSSCSLTAFEYKVTLMWKHIFS